MNGLARRKRRDNQTLQWTGPASSVLVESKSVGAVPAIERWSVMQRQLTGKDDSFIDLVGKEPDSPEVAAFVAEFGPLESQDSPPFRVYLGAPEKGIDLLVENGNVLDVQIRVKPSKTYKPFSGGLPFGLQAGMTQNQVHESLGVPKVFDEFDSRYELRPGIMLIICYAYDGSSEIQQLHISLREKK